MSPQGQTETIEKLEQRFTVTGRTVTNNMCVVYVKNGAVIEIRSPYGLVDNAILFRNNKEYTASQGKLLPEELLESLTQSKERDRVTPRLFGLK